jgi:hypothetical protein
MLQHLELPAGVSGISWKMGRTGLGEQPASVMFSEKTLIGAQLGLGDITG